MSDWLEEILIVLAHSPRTQFAVAFGVASFVGFILAGEYFVGRFELHGMLAPLTGVVREHLWSRYDHAAWGALVSSLLLAVRLYRKDRTLLLGV